MKNNSSASQIADTELDRVILKETEKQSKVIHIQKVKAKPSDKSLPKQARACRPQGE